MRMARVNVSIPDELHERARRAGLNVSRLAAGALEAELDRRDKRDALASYLAELEAELGLVQPADAEAAEGWADRVQKARP